MLGGKSFRKALVLGIDGLDPAICRDLMARGALPNLAKLAGGGSFHALATVNPAQSPVAWTCLGTGTNPGCHGVFDFIVRDPKTYLPRLSLHKNAPGGAPLSPYAGVSFFELAAGAGVPTTVVRWPLTYPAGNGPAKVLAGLGAPDVKGRLGNYVFYAEGLSLAGGRGRVVPVVFRDGRAEAAVEGPLTVVLGKRTPAVLTMILTRREGRLHCAVSGQEVALAEGQWSPHLPLAFAAPDGRPVAGLVQLHLGRLEPLELYLGPIQVDPRSPCLPIAGPPGYAAELAAALGGPYATLGMPEETKGLTDGALSDEAFLALCEAVTREREAMLAFELGRFHEGLLAFVFDTSDRLQHMFWRIFDPAHPLYDPALAQRLGPVIEDHYRRMDAAVGAALAAAGDDTALFVCSDHGFCAYTRSVNLNTWLAEAGYMQLKPRDPADAGELLRHVDWAGTRAYALGFGSIYLNLAGRERDGQVRPGEEAAGLAREIAARLTAATDAGHSPVHRVYHGAGLYHGPLAEAAPDLVVGCRPPYRVSFATAIGGLGREPFEDNRQKWSGDHCVDASFVPGVLFSNLSLPMTGPVPQTRLAATVCRALGLEPGPAMEPPLS